MKKIFPIITIVLCALALMLCGFKGFAQTPPYTGVIDNTVKIPCAKYGKNYHLTGDRLGGSSVTQEYVDSLFLSDPGGITVPQMEDSIQSALSGLQGLVLQSGIYNWTGNAVIDSVTVSFVPLGAGVHYHVIPIARSESPFFWIGTHNDGSFVVKYSTPPGNGKSITFDWAIIKQF